MSYVDTKVVHTMWPRRWILDREFARFDAQPVSRFHLVHDEDGRARRRAGWWN